MDRDIIVNKVKNQGDLPAYSFTPPYTDGAKLVEPEWFKWSQEKRNEEAKKLLAEAGYTAEKPLTFDLLYNTSDLHKKLAIAAASIWKKNLGANVKLENQEWKTFLDTRHQGNYDVSRAGWCADYNEPTSFLNMVLSDSSNNTVHYKSPVFDKLIADTLKVTDEAQRSELYSKAEQQLDKDSAIVPVYYYVNARLVKPWVGGYSGKDPMDPTLFILITISFFMMRLAPGSPFTGERALPPEVLANIEAKYHLNDPISTQYFSYLKQLAHGDFGPSFKYKDYTVNDLVASSFPVSAKLGAAAFILAVLVGVSAGVIAALKQNTRWDYTVMGVAMTGVVIPSFVVAPLLVMIFAITLKWLPGGGWNGGALKFMILPMVALSLAYIASIARITRGSMIEVLHSNFIRTARAKGLPMRRIIFRHALKPALLPVLSYMGPAFVGIITGSMVIETIYGLPGIGQLFVNGALNRDYSLVLSLTILVGTLTIVFNAIVDVLYAVIDPKIRY